MIAIRRILCYTYCGGKFMPVFSVYSSPTLLFRHLTDENPDDSFFQMHIHEQFEILYFVSGSAQCLVETSSYRMMPDTLMLMRPMESHRINILGREPYERYTINFSAELVDAVDPERSLLAPFYDRRLGEKNMYRASELDIHPHKLFSAMQPHTETESSRRTEILTYFFALLGQLGSAFAVKKGEPVPDRNTLANEIAGYINEHLFQELSLRIVADTFYISVSQLNRIFRNSTGFSVWDYVTGKRLAAARSRIRDGMPATRAFAACGFNDYSSFYRLYLKKFGVTPKQDFEKKL